MVWESIEDIFKPEVIPTLHLGQVFMFDYEGSRTELKIMRITPKGRVWAREIHTHHPDEVKGEAAVLSAMEDREVTVGEVVEKLKERDV